MEMTRMDIEKVAKAIEADAGEALPDLRQALAEAREEMGRVTTPEQVLVRRACRKRPSPSASEPRWRRCATGNKGALRRRARCCACCA